MPGFLAEVMTWASSYPYTLGVETALNFGVPPTTFIVEGKQPSDGWSRADKKLAMAWTILQRETCSICGQPLWICRSSNKNLMFSVKTDICYANAELEKWKASRKAKNLKKGEHPYVVPKMYNDEKLPTRQAYLEELSE